MEFHTAELSAFAEEAPASAEHRTDQAAGIPSWVAGAQYIVAYNYCGLETTPDGSSPETGYLKCMVGDTVVLLTGCPEPGHPGCAHDWYVFARRVSTAPKDIENSAVASTRNEAATASGRAEDYTTFGTPEHAMNSMLTVDTAVPQSMTGWIPSVILGARIHCLMDHDALPMSPVAQSTVTFDMAEATVQASASPRVLAPASTACPDGWDTFFEVAV